MLDDPALVRSEYASEERLAVRRAVWDGAEGPDPRDIVLEAVAALAPARVLEVGSGQGELAARMREALGCEVTAIDASPRMVELTRERGVDARVGDVEELPFPDGAFDCAVAAWMLYHVRDRQRGIAELARVLRPGGRLVAVTNSRRSLAELWDLFGAAAERDHPFSRENGLALLARSFVDVHRRDVDATVVFPSREAALAYVRASVTRAHLAERMPPFRGPLEARRAVTVFVAEKAG